MQKTWPARATILGADGTPLTTQGQVVTIGVEGRGSRTPPRSRRRWSRPARPASEASSAIAAAKAHPTFFEPVFTVTQARYNQIQPTIYPIPGTVFQTGDAR